MHTFVFLLFVFLGSKLFASPAIAGDFFHRVSLEDVQKIVDEKKPSQVDDLIAILPENLRMTSSFVYKGHAVLGASEKHPRVLLWNEAGAFAMTFKSHASEAGPDVIEAIQYDRTQNLLRFYELDLQNTRPQFKEQASCLTCHGENHPRAIWAQYPDWEGIVGSDDDRITRIESAMLTSQKWAEQSRLKLLFPKDNTAWWREGFPVRNTKRDLKHETGYLHRMNLRFGVMANRWLIDQTLHRILRSVQNDKELIEITEAVLGCTDDTQKMFLLQRWGLSLRDLDMRFTAQDRIALTPEQIYFDGTGTVWELLGSELLRQLESRRGFDFNEMRMTLLKKYPPVSASNVTVAPLFKVLDQDAAWLPLPYTPTRATVHQRRETWNSERERNYKMTCVLLNNWKQQPF